MAGEDLQSKATEMVKKILMVGVGTIFLTEESIRGMVSELKLPKELLAGVLESAQKTKRDFLQNLSDEFSSRILSRIDPKEFMQEFLSQNEVHLDMKIKFSPKNAATTHERDTHSADRSTVPPQFKA